MTAACSVLMAIFGGATGLVLAVPGTIAELHSRRQLRSSGPYRI
jgi:hypothetical protein